jgi:thiamine-phosphate pyrophosphorylase
VIALKLAEAGLAVQALLDDLERAQQADSAPIPLASEIPHLELVEPGQAVDLSRILDASANRAREGLRVVEDYIRFVLDDPLLTRRIKEVRHRLGEAIQGLDQEMLLASRDTRGDVGTHIMTETEQSRENPRAVLMANFARTGEALRSLEEYTKLLNVWLSGRFEILRYDVYTLEKLTLTALASRKGLKDVNLMVLVGGLPTFGDLTWIVGEALAGGAGAIQLREKGLPDRELLRRAREVRILTAQAHARFIMNDRPDLARLAGADAVHLGQEDVSIRDARRVVGSSMLIGVSTHERTQLEKAVLEGASYLGVGPVFASLTKDFDDLAGIGYVRKAAEESNLPWFAIGGITEANLDEVLEAGARRVAVSSAVVRAEFPRQAAKALRERLDAAN